MDTVVDSVAHGRADAVSVGSLLAWGSAQLTAATETPRLDAELLLAFATGASRSVVMAFPERPVAAAPASAYRELVGRRAEGWQLASIVGIREFYSLPLAVDETVLIPRPETELLVDEALSRLRDAPGAALLDLGTGSGAIALAIKQARPDVEVTATDLDPSALAVARRNGEKMELRVHWVLSDWFAGLAGRRFDVIVSNPPYVRSDDPHLAGALRFEPRLALDGGRDGLAAFRAIFRAARTHLINRGVLLLEHGWDQRAELARLAARSDFEIVRAVDDLGGRPRVLVLRGR